MLYFIFFFFNDTATTEIYTLSLHDALPISRHPVAVRRELRERERTDAERDQAVRDAGGTLQPHRAAGLERALELRGAGGLDPPHRGATARRRQPGHHARDEPAPAHGHHHRPDVGKLLRDLEPD